jgi:uncharacterized protein YdhG (YjbR/CyaY superfamily)
MARKRSPAATATSRSPEIDAMLADLPDDIRIALEDLRGKIHAAAPDAVEAIAYSVPAFKYRGRPLVSFSAGRRGAHCSFHVQSPEVVDAHRDDLRGYDTTAGTIHFSPERLLPADLVTKIVRARMAETDAAAKK